MWRFDKKGGKSLQTGEVEISEDVQRLPVGRQVQSLFHGKKIKVNR